MLSSQELQEQADTLTWFHTIDLGSDVVTKGAGLTWYGPEIFPDLTDRSVLDIGAWDGRSSFLAEQQKARRVVALDHYAWGVDLGARQRYWNECAANGTLPDHRRDVTDFWLSDLPGRRPFEFARTALNSRVEDIAADFTTMNLSDLGLFDVVFYLGVLYHMEEPLTCLKRVRSVTGEVAVIETEAVHIENHDVSSLLQFHPGDSLRADYGNWWVPTISGLRDLCMAAGFSSVETIVGPPAPPVLEPESLTSRLRRRIAHVPRSVQTSAPSANYRAVVHAFV
jgi:tRNA (mo5U34)-methyltransferase